MIYHTQYRQYKIIADKKKSQIIFKDIIEIYFNVQTV